MSRPARWQPTLEYWSWQADAACRGHESLFFNGDTENKGLRRRKEVRAIEVCRACPVMDRCREFALGTGELYGVWGGLTELERHRISGRHRSG